MKHSGMAPALEKSLLEGLTAHAGEVLPAFVRNQRWFRSRERTISSTRIADSLSLDFHDKLFECLFVEFSFTDSTSETYFVPLRIFSENDTSFPKETPRMPVRAEGAYAAVDALSDADFQLWLVENCLSGETLASESGKILFRSKADSDRGIPPAAKDLRLLKAEQSNTSFLIKEESIFKVYRKLETEINPEVEMLDFFRAHDYTSVPLLKAEVIYEKGDRRSSLGMMQSFIKNEGDGWKYVLKIFENFFSDFIRGDDDDATLDRMANYLLNPLMEIRQVGLCTARMHLSLASDCQDPAFVPEAIGQDDIRDWKKAYADLAEITFAIIQRKMGEEESSGNRVFYESLLEKREKIVSRPEILRQMSERRLTKIRYHGDFHLGQVLRGEKEWILYDFEGEPLRKISDRKRKASPLKDAAGMLRSFSYAGYVSAKNFSAQRNVRQDKLEYLRDSAERLLRRAFLKGYLFELSDHKATFISGSTEENFAYLSFFEMEKAIYELYYELNNRPDWVFVPLQGIQRLIR